MAHPNSIRYYRAVVLPRVAAKTGTSRDAAHAALKESVFRGSTSAMPEAEFRAKLSRIRTEMAALGVWIPLPNEPELPPECPKDAKDET